MSVGGDATAARRRSPTPGRSEAAAAVRRLGDGEQGVGGSEGGRVAARRRGRLRRASSTAYRRGTPRTARGCRRRGRRRRRRRGAWRRRPTRSTPRCCGGAAGPSTRIVTAAVDIGVAPGRQRRVDVEEAQPLLVVQPLLSVGPRVGDGELDDVVDGTFLGEPLVDQVDVAEVLPQRQLDRRRRAPQVVDLAGAARWRRPLPRPTSRCSGRTRRRSRQRTCARRRTRRRRRARSPFRDSAATSTSGGARTPGRRADPVVDRRWPCR